MLLVRELCRIVELPPGEHTPWMTAEDVWVMPDGTLRARVHSGRAGRGAFRFMSPEQVRGRPMDERSTVYNVATLAWEGLTGRALHEGKSDLQLLEAIRDAKVPGRPEAMPVELFDVLVRALQPAAAGRWPSLAALSEALAPLQGALGHGTLKALIAPHLATPQLVGPAKDVEAGLVNAISRGDDGARHVYADWLLEAGRSDEARWLQLELAVRTATGMAQSRLLGELKTLQRKLSAGFIASVARQPLENCPVKFGFQCPLKWTSLERTVNENVRWCSGCHSEVHYCTTLERAQELAMAGACVAVDLGVTRTPDDLTGWRDGMMMGRMA